MSADVNDYSGKSPSDFGPWPSSVPAVDPLLVKDFETHLDGLKMAKSHSYMKSRMLIPYGALDEPTLGDLYIPMKNIIGLVTGVWVISTRTKPRLWVDSVVEGSACRIGDIDPLQEHLICANYECGLALHMVTKQTVFVTFTDSNVKTIADIYRRQGLNLAICSTRDRAGGIEMHQNAAREFQLKLFTPATGFKNFYEEFFSNITGKSNGGLMGARW